jgi:DNA-binding beta-propeller fold protein YncE
MPMSFRRVGWLTAMVLASLFWMSCGEVYRPVVIPVSTTPPNPANFHAVFGVSSNVSPNPGSVLQIDVSGDTNIGVANMGLNPTHAVALPNSSRVFVASAGSLTPGNSDIITGFSPAFGGSFATGISNLNVFSLPNVGPNQASAITAISESGNVVTVTLATAITQATVGGPIVISGVAIGGYDGNFVISSVNGTTLQYVATATGLNPTTGGTATVPVPTFCSYLPDFVATAQNNVVFVANYGAENGATCSFASTDSVALLNASSGTVSNIAYLNPANSTPAPHPVALAETPNAQHLYVVNQGNNTVVDLSPTDLSTLATIPVGNIPVWAVARADNQRVYVLTQGSGTLIPIDTTTNTILASQTNLSVGAGANFLLYDSRLNRLYVTNPTTGNVFVFSATGGVDLSGNANDTPKLLATISMTAGTNPPCSSACSPVSVTALPDGSRFYVASYQTETSCPDPNVGATACIIPILTVFDAPSMKVKSAPSSLLAGSPSLSLLTSPPFSPTQYAVPPLAACAPPATYAPGSTRFRMFTSAATDSSHVYVSICDAGAVADVITTTNTISQGTNSPDTLVTDITAPFGACTGGNCSSAAPITSFSITSNVVTFQAVNNFVAGQQVQISGLTTGTYLNGQTLTVLATGLSGNQFQAVFTHSDVTATTDSGTALGLQVATITSFSINSNVITFQATNTFTAGTRVSISGLTSTAATNAGLDTQTLTVIATGLSGTQFECVLPIATSNVGPTTDTGTAVPQVPPQTPIFLVTGQ